MYRIYVNILRCKKFLLKYYKGHKIYLDTYRTLIIILCLRHFNNCQYYAASNYDLLV